MKLKTIEITFAIKMITKINIQVCFDKINVLYLCVIIDKFSAEKNTEYRNHYLSLTERFDMRIKTEQQNNKNKQKKYSNLE